MAEPPIKRYALVPGSRDGGLRRFHLARVESEVRSRPERLERMEEVADRERRDAARPAGFEPAASRSGGERSIH
jgi:hypothetical protein